MTKSQLKNYFSKDPMWRGFQTLVMTVIGGMIIHFGNKSIESFDELRLDVKIMKAQLSEYKTDNAVNKITLSEAQKNIFRLEAKVETLESKFDIN